MEINEMLDKTVVCMELCATAEIHKDGHPPWPIPKGVLRYDRAKWDSCPETARALLLVGWIADVTGLSMETMGPGRVHDLLSGLAEVAKQRVDKDKKEASDG